MKKLILCFLAAVGVNIIAVADAPSRLPSDADVVTGYWHRNFDKAKAYAEENDIPFFAVWSRDYGCHFCDLFSNWISDPDFISWQQTSGIVFWYGSESDYPLGSAAAQWTLGRNSALPALHLWWKDRTDETVSGRTASIGGSGAQALIDYIEQTFGGYVPYKKALNRSSSKVNFSVSWTNPWCVEDGSSVLRSGAIGGNSSSGLSATIQSSGTFSFEWCASCESNETHTADHAVFLIDDVEAALIDGETEWRTVSVRIDSDLSHSVAWVYSKDGSNAGDSVHDDCVRVRNIMWARDPTVIFNANGGHFDGGMVTLSRVVVLGTAVGELPVPNGDGRRFLGWMDAHTGAVVDAETVMSNDVVLYAQWEKCIVAFNFNSLPAGQTCSLNNDGEWQTTMTLSRGSARTFFIRNNTAESSVCGLDVEGIYTYKEDGEIYEDSIWPSEYVEAPNALGGVDYYVVLTRDDWEWSMAKKALFTITVSGFYDEGNQANNRFEFGSTPGYAAPKTQKYDRGATFGTLPLANRGVDWQFLGWFSEPVGGDEITTNTIATEMTCYAHWMEIRTARFDENSHDECSGRTDDIVVDPGEEVEIPECGFIREGRTFIGWATSPNGTVEYHPGDIVTMDDDILLYAIWDGPPRFIVDEWGNLEYFEMNGASEVHIPDTVKYISAGMLDALPDSLFDTNSIPCLRMLDGWVVGVSDDYWNTYGTGEEDAPCWNLDLSGIRGVVDGAFWGDLRISSLVATQPVLDAGVSAMFGTSVSSIIVADGATAIWQHSLSYLENLTNLTIASSVAIVEQDAFDGCPESLFKTGVVSGLKTVDGWVVGLAEDYWDIYGQYDEFGRLVKSELDLTGARGVAEYALQYAEYAYSAFIPADMLNIGGHSFSGCPISAYSVASGNPNYSSSGGMLLSKDGKTLIRVPQGMWKVHVPKGVETVAHGAFCDSGHGIVAFPATVTKIDDGAFLGCSIDRVVFNGDAPEVDDGTVADLGCGMVYISDDAEGWGESLPGEWHGLPTDSKDAEFSIDESGWLAWVETKGTTDIRIPSGVTKILGGAFGDCWMIDSVKIPSSVTSIEQGAFDGCDNSFFDTDTIPGVKVADGWVVGLSDDYWNVVEPCGIELSVDLRGIRGISDYAFQGANMLVSADIPDSVRQIGDGAFESCANLLNVRLGSGVERIGAYAFRGCPESLFASGIRSGFVVASNNSYSPPMFDALMVGDWVVGWTVINASGYTTMELSGVRGIADHAFEGCGELSGLSAHSLEHVGANAFDGCQDSLFDVSSVPGARVVAGWIVGPSDGGSQNGELVVKSARGIADGSFAFTDVQLVVIGVDCERIGQSAFQGCANLVHAKIGQGVSEIGVNAFAWCNEELYDTATASGASLVDGWVVGCTIPQNGIVDLAGVRGLSDYAFADCDEIEEVRLADGLVRISSGAFSGCGNLRSVSIPDSVTRIGHFAFDGCGGLFGAVHASQGLRIVDGWAVGVDQIDALEGDVALPSLRGIADFAFAGCRAMTSVIVPKSVNGIGYGSFSGCASLSSMVLPFVGARRGNSDAPDAVFGYIFGSMPYSGAVAVRQTFREPVYSSGCSYGYAPGARYESVYYVPASLKRVEITDETHLGYGAFNGCAGLEYVSLNDGLPVIVDYAFAGCTGLEAIDIPCSIEEIGDSAFCGCSALKSITLGEDVAYIGYCAFGECTELRDVYFLGDAPYAEYDVFDGASKRMTIHVAPGTTGWLSGSTDELPSYWPCYLDGEHDGYGRRIKFAHTEPSEDGSSGSGGGTQGGVSGVVTGDLLLTITNVVIHYVTQSIPSSAVIPSATAGIVNIVSEVNAGSAVAITQEWAAQYPGFASKFGSDFTKAVTAQTGKVDGAGKPMLVWQDFVAGTDPTNPEDVFQASITFDAETGEPVISWTPELPSAEAAKRLYRKYGKVRLTDEDWTLVTDDASAYNFFKVSVEMR